MKKHQIPFLEVIVIVVCLFILVRLLGIPLWQKETPPLGQEQITFSLMAGGPLIVLEGEGNRTLYAYLEEANGEGKINFTAKEYMGLGFFVTEIGELQEGGGKHLLYYINGNEASVGVSTYLPQNGDHVDWKLE
ncbi:MAG: DUF4430 domain-containing protein [Candidatus Pacebacteria bacterium]|nr:DUF4430 domain-containing protein [Candidatus Paceibacterota bacterium]